MNIYIPSLVTKKQHKEILEDQASTKSYKVYLDMQSKLMHVTFAFHLTLVPASLLWPNPLDPNPTALFGPSAFAHFTVIQHIRARTSC